MLETIAEAAIYMATLWVFIMNYSWFTRNRPNGDAWHWTVLAGPNVYMNHMRDERNHDLRVVARVTSAAADDWRKRYIWR